MRNILNKVFVTLFGFPYYIDNDRNTILSNKPTFTSYYPEDYDANDTEKFNSWSRKIFFYTIKD